MADEIRRLSDELARDPSSLVFLPLADALRRAGNLMLAVRVSVRGLERHPYLADAHDMLARICADQGDLERAADEWDMALRLDPSHRSARRGLGFVDFRRGDLERAEERLRDAAAGDDDPSAAAALAHVRAALAARTDATPDVASLIPTRLPPEPAIVATPAPALPEPSVPPVVAERPMTSAEARNAAVNDARRLFAPLLGEEQRTALLLDEDGMVLAGAYVDADGRDVSEEVGAELAGVRSEAERSLRHLGLGAWTSLVVEADAAIVAMAPASHRGMVLVAASRATPVGLVRVLLDRALALTRDWFARIG